MRIGNQTSINAAGPLEPFEFAVAQGFDAFEFFADRKDGRGFDFTQLEADQRQAVARTGWDANIRFSVHPPIPASPIGADQLRQLEAAIDFAAAIAATVVVVHLEADTDNAAFVQALQPMLTDAESAGLTLAIENTPAIGPDQLNDLFARFAQRGQASTPLGLCLDIGHANLCPDLPRDYLGYLDRLADHVPLAHLHVHENFGDGDTHLPPGEGPAGDDPAGLAGLMRRLHDRAYTGSLIIETWPDPPERLCQSRNFLQGLEAHERRGR
jgi:sugar phosphate isomerase/epimerase